MFRPFIKQKRVLLIVAFINLILVFVSYHSYSLFDEMQKMEKYPGKKIQVLYQGIDKKDWFPEENDLNSKLDSTTT